MFKLPDSSEDALDDVVVDGRRVSAFGEVGKGGKVFTQGGDLARNGVDDDLFADVGAGESPGNLAGGHPSELELAVELHGHLLRDRRIDGCAERIVDRRKARGAGTIENGEVLAVRVAVADQEVEDDAVNEAHDVGSRKPKGLKNPCAVDD